MTSGLQTILQIFLFAVWTTLEFAENSPTTHPVITISLNCTREGSPASAFPGTSYRMASAPAAHWEFADVRVLPPPPIIEAEASSASACVKRDEWLSTGVTAQILPTCLDNENCSACNTSKILKDAVDFLQINPKASVFVIAFPSNYFRSNVEQFDQLTQGILIESDAEKRPRFGVLLINVTTVKIAQNCRLAAQPRKTSGQSNSNSAPDSDTSTNNNESMLTNFSRTSVLFVSISFIILMVISLAWLLFYYVQRFRYAHAKDRLARRLFNAAKKALTKIPAKALRPGDRELDSDCPVCIEPYRLNDIIRILPCKHLFHKSCVDPWLLEHRTCPMCKMDILKAFGYQFCHNSSQDSVHQIDGDQLSGGTSTDGRNSFPLAVESDLHDPFFPSPAPSPSLVQPVMHQGSALGYAIIPLTVHGMSISSRVSDSSESSNGSNSCAVGSSSAAGSTRPLFHGTSAEVHRRLTTSSSGSTDEASLSTASANCSPEKLSAASASFQSGHKLPLLRPTKSMIVHSPSPKSIVTIVETKCLDVPYENRRHMGTVRLNPRHQRKGSASVSAYTKRSFSLPGDAVVPSTSSSHRPGKTVAEHNVRN